MANKVSSLKVGNSSFFIVNGGVELRIGNEQDRYNPEESIKLLEWLTEHAQDFRAAVKPSEPPFGSKE